MVLDTSALGAILLREADATRFLERLANEPINRMSAATLVEATSVCVGKRLPNLEREMDIILAAAEVEIVSVSVEQAEIARAAYRRFGKGRHAARLNLGDTFSYALAMHLNEPLLFKGNDFAQTDVISAL